MPNQTRTTPEHLAADLRRIADIIVKHQLEVLGIDYSSGRNAWSILVDAMPEELEPQCTKEYRYSREYDALRTTVDDVEIVQLIEVKQ